MKAMILAAGLGTRLRPLTNSTPKALVKIKGKTMLEIIIQRMKHFGFHDIVINVHHLPEKIISYLHEKKHFGINIYFSHENDKLLDTGGGIKQARQFLDKSGPFLVHNVDVISNVDLGKIYNYHIEQNALATLVVKNKGSDRSLLFDRNWHLAGWKNITTGEYKIITDNNSAGLHGIGFCGIHVISPDIFDLMQSNQVFSIINTYMNIALNHKIIGYNAEKNLWIDIGSHEQLETASKLDPQTYLIKKDYL